MKRPSGESTAPVRLSGGCCGAGGASGLGCGGGGAPMRTPEPPSRWYMNNQNVPGSGGRDFETMMYCPSGVQEGDTMICGRSLVRPSLLTALGLEPSALAIQRFSTPLRSLRNAMVFPSGEYTGWLSNDRPPMMRVAAPPSVPIV